MTDVPLVRFTDEPDDELASCLSALRDIVTRHPVAVQAVFSALVAEGRRYARTSEGGALRDQLAESELLARLRIVWESLSMTAFAERSDQALPSFFLDGIVKAAAADGLETLLSEAFDGRV